VIELSGVAGRVVRTRIGSPYVIAAMMDAAAAQPEARVCGYEANGGFLLGSAVEGLTALPTRDALLPIIAVVLAGDSVTGASLADVVAALPPRYTFSDRVAISRKRIARRWSRSFRRGTKRRNWGGLRGCLVTLRAFPPASTPPMAIA
jgi:phosphomannomutase